MTAIAPTLDTTGYPADLKAAAEAHPECFAGRAVFVPMRWFLPFSFQRGRRVHFFEFERNYGGAVSGRALRDAFAACGHVIDPTVVFTASVGGPWPRCAHCLREVKKRGLKEAPRP